jgi:hypothetical protein
MRRPTEPAGCFSSPAGSSSAATRKPQRQTSAFKEYTAYEFRPKNSISYSSMQRSKLTDVMPAIWVEIGMQTYSSELKEALGEGEQRQQPADHSSRSVGAARLFFGGRNSLADEHGYVWLPEFVPYSDRDHTMHAIKPISASRHRMMNSASHDLLKEVCETCVEALEGSNYDG